MLDQPSAAAPLSMSGMLFNLIVGVGLAAIVQWHFVKFSSTLNNKNQFAQIFPFLILTTALIITVVKSSLALSLGLVGALSIVRFRTPIKEPEELAYLFLCISIGLGLGAEQTLPVVVASGVILAVMAVAKRKSKEQRNRNLYLSLDWPTETATEKPLNRLNEVINKYVNESDIRRYDVRNQHNEAVYFVDLPSSEHLNDLVEDLKTSFPGMGVTFIDQTQVPSV